MKKGVIDNLYGYPDVGRTGLGHGLLAWARCAIWCRDTGATMLAPRWLRPRIGPYLRRERDKRNYFLLFHKGKYVGEPHRSWILLTASRLYAELDLPEPGFTTSRPTVVVFRNAIANNEQKMFHLVAKDGPFLREQLMRMTKPSYLPKPAKEPFIAVHVRMGDFSHATVEQLKAGATNARIPVEWYVSIVQRLRSALGIQIPLVVFSDGTDEALRPLLKLPNVMRAPHQSAITDLLSISQAELLVASGSGFSRWGAFLGSVPRVSFPGQSHIQNGQSVDTVIENDGSEDLPLDLISSLNERCISVSA